MPLSEILSHDLFPYSPLFSGDLPSHAEKHTLVSALEDLLPNKPVFDFQIEEPMAIVVDFLATFRQRNLSNFITFGDALKDFVTSCINFTPNFISVHVLLDSYPDFSLKSGEKRSQGIEPIHIVNMNLSTPVPKQLEKFWASTQNKVSLLQIFRAFVASIQMQIFVNIVIRSMIVDNEVISAVNGYEEIPELTNFIDEADPKVPVHLSYLVNSQLTLHNQ